MTTRRRRIAWFGPWPPTASGVADYCALVVRQLARYVEIDVFATGDSESNDEDVRVFPFSAFAERDAQQRYDTSIYNVGNDVRLAAVYNRALRTPGIVILHDPVLHPLVSELTWGSGSIPNYWRELSYGHEPATADEIVDFRSMGREFAIEAYSLTARLADASLGVVVHSRFAESLVQATSSAARTRVVPHAAFPLQKLAREQARVALGLPANSYVVGLFGFATAHKRYHVVLDAFRWLRASVSDALLVLVGAATPTCPIDDLIRARGMDKITRQAGWVDESTLENYLNAVDVSVHLRYPTMGETSGSAVRCLTAGHPLVVSNHGWFAELPDSVAIHVDAGIDETTRVAAALVELATNADRRHRMGEAASTYASTVLRADSAASALYDFIEEVLSGIHGNQTNVSIEQGGSLRPGA